MNLAVRTSQIAILVLAILAIGVIQSCSQRQKVASDPKDCVIKLFGAMERNDQGVIAHLLDLPALMSIRDEDYALQTSSPRVFRDPVDVLEDLTGEGLTKARWFSMQRVIGAVEEFGDSAKVEVSFINKNTNTKYYNKFGLHKVKGGWKIYSFKTLSPDIK